MNIFRLRRYISNFGFDCSLIHLHALGLSGTYRLFEKLYGYLPEDIIAHRLYYEKDLRGFGERAFHAAWYWIFLNYFSKQHHKSIFRALEIGVYRGQTLTLWPLIARILSIDVEVVGLSPFSTAGDEVSDYIDLSYYDDVQTHARYFGVLGKISLVKAYSNESIGISLIRDSEWDLIYIDGSHDYGVAKSDFVNSLHSLRKGGLIVFDDSSSFCSELPAKIRWNGFQGHPGPTRVVAEIKTPSLLHLMSVGHLNFFVKLDD